MLTVECGISFWDSLQDILVVINIFVSKGTVEGNVDV